MNEIRSSSNASMNEIWKDIEGYEGYYQVSNLGNVRSVDRVIISNDGIVRVRKGKAKTLKDHNGYKRVKLNKDGKEKLFLVHRLVAQTFIPNPSNLPCINHKDEVKSNNRIDNLEWCTHRYNRMYGTTEERRRPKLAKKVYQYTLDGELVNVWPSLAECTKDTFDNGSVSKACNGKLKTYKGFIFSYTPIKKERHKAPPVQLEFDF